MFLVGWFLIADFKVFLYIILMYLFFIADFCGTIGNSSRRIVDTGFCLTHDCDKNYF